MFSDQPSIPPGLRAPDPPTPAGAWGPASLLLSLGSKAGRVLPIPRSAPGEQASGWSPTAQANHPGYPLHPCRSHQVGKA